MDRARQNQDSYDRVADQYLERSRDRSLLRPWMQRFKERLPSDAPVLDLGAGPCLDSAELRSLGLRVISVDRSWRMLMAAHEETPGQRVQADIRQLPFQPDCLAGVWACASLLHLDREQLVPAVSDIRNVLVSEGALFVSLKCGSGEGMGHIEIRTGRSTLVYLLVGGGPGFSVAIGGFRNPRVGDSSRPA